MARLPDPGGDVGVWGDVLNDFLSTAHRTDGTLKDGAVDTSSIQNGTISETKLDAALVNKINAASSGVAPDATTSTKGVVQLTGDLGGTAASPTVPGLSAKANASTTITGTGSIAGGGSLAANRTLSLLNDNAAPGASRYYGTDGAGSKGYFALPAVSVADGSLTPAKLSANSPGSGQILSYNGTGFAWIPAPSAPVSSVNGQTGAVVLDAGDITGFATVATTGSYSDLTGTPAAAIPLTSQATWPIVPARTTATVDYNTGTSAYPARPTSRTDIVVRWRGPVPPTVGGSGAVDNVDEWVNTP